MFNARVFSCVGIVNVNRTATNYKPPFDPDLESFYIIMKMRSDNGFLNRPLTIFMEIIYYDSLGFNLTKFRNNMYYVTPSHHHISLLFIIKGLSDRGDS